MLRLERDTYIDFEHALAQGLRLVALQRRAYSVDGAFPYSGYTVSSRGVQKGLTSAAGVDSSATGHTFLVVANLAAVSSDAVAFGRLRYTGGANYGAGLRFNAATLELDGGIGTSAWHYSASSSAVQTGRHVYAGAIGVGDSTSTGRLWRDGALLTTGVHSATAYASTRWDSQIDLGSGTATGATAITGAISGHIESGLYYTRSLPTEDVVYLSAAMLRGRLPFMRRRRIWVPVSAGAGGTTHDVAQNDAVSASAIEAALLGALGSTAESATATEAIQTLLTAAVATAEAASAAEAVTTGATQSADAAETVTATSAASASALTSGQVAGTTTVSDTAAALAALAASLPADATAGAVIAALLTAEALLGEATMAAETTATGPVTSAASNEALSTADVVAATATWVAQLAADAAASSVESALAVLAALVTEAAVTSSAQSATLPATVVADLDAAAAVVEALAAAVAGVLAGEAAETLLVPPDFNRISVTSDLRRIVVPPEDTGPAVH